MNEYALRCTAVMALAFFSDLLHTRCGNVRVSTIRDVGIGCRGCNRNWNVFVCFLNVCVYVEFFINTKLSVYICC